MSRAFVKELDGSETVENLPEKLISGHANFVTSQGFDMIEAEVARFQLELAQAQAASDKQAIARVSRDLRYWSDRSRTAEVMPPPSGNDVVQFGSTVKIVRDGGRKQRYKIVGEDEADPSKGTISYVSPLARALMGKSAGDVVSVGMGEVEITAIG
jgi:transcription elongation GreA/GreB family factor